MSGEIDMNNNRITNIPNGVSANDAVNLSQVQNLVNVLNPLNNVANLIETISGVFNSSVLNLEIPNQLTYTNNLVVIYVESVYSPNVIIPFFMHRYQNPNSHNFPLASSSNNSYTLNTNFNLSMHTFQISSRDFNLTNQIYSVQFYQLV